MGDVVDEGDPHAWVAEASEPIHTWFGLTYANYQVLHRSLMQSMPVEWQRRMVQCLAELESAYQHVDKTDSFLVQARDSTTGRFITDPIPHYDRGRAFVAPLLEKTA